jgi:putative transport protein
VRLVPGDRVTVVGTVGRSGTLIMGLVAGVHTQPAVLGWALEQTKDDVPNIGYASAYPAATIAKLLLVQLIVALG